MQVCTYLQFPIFHLFSQLSIHSTRYANVTLAQPCQLENTTYISLDLRGEQVMFVVIRDNCRAPEFFCDPATMLCGKTKSVGSVCRMDGECDTVSAIPVRG